MFLARLLSDSIFTLFTFWFFAALKNALPCRLLMEVYKPLFDLIPSLIHHQLWIHLFWGVYCLKGAEVFSNLYIISLMLTIVYTL